MATKFVEILPKINKISVNYKIISDFSLTQLYKRLLSDILCNGPTG